MTSHADTGKKAPPEVTVAPRVTPAVRQAAIEVLSLTKKELAKPGVLEHEKSVLNENVAQTVALIERLMAAAGVRVTFRQGEDPSAVVVNVGLAGKEPAIAGTVAEPAATVPAATAPAVPSAATAAAVPAVVTLPDPSPVLRSEEPTVPTVSPKQPAVPAITHTTPAPEAVLPDNAAPTSYLAPGGNMGELSWDALVRGSERPPEMAAVLRAAGVSGFDISSVELPVVEDEPMATEVAAAQFPLTSAVVTPPTVATTPFTSPAAPVATQQVAPTPAWLLDTSYPDDLLTNTPPIAAPVSATHTPPVAVPAVPFPLQAALANVSATANIPQAPPAPELDDEPEALAKPLAPIAEPAATQPTAFAQPPSFQSAAFPVTAAPVSAAQTPRFPTPSAPPTAFAPPPRNVTPSTAPVATEENAEEDDLRGLRGTSFLTGRRILGIAALIGGLALAAVALRHYTDDETKAENSTTTPADTQPQQAQGAGQNAAAPAAPKLQQSDSIIGTGCKQSEASSEIWTVWCDSVSVAVREILADRTGRLEVTQGGVTYKAEVKLPGELAPIGDNGKIVFKKE
ncbi:MAG: hypothetical protein AAB588_01120 [Patescibacteria group bacterium]